jgi:hypothetical protein
LCLGILAADRIKPNKLKHSEMKNKLKEHLHRKLDDIRIQQKSFVNTITESSKTLLASNQVSYRIAENKKPQTTADTVILLALICAPCCWYKQSFSMDC